MGASDVVIIGGSIAGLMHGVVLRSIGKSVTILESRQQHELQAEAAGLSLGPHAQELMSKYAVWNDPVAIQTRGSQFLSPAGVVLNEIPPAFSVTTSTWSVVFERLKAKFVEQGLSDLKATYETGAKVIRFEEQNQGASFKIICRDEHTETDRIYEAPLLIAADGARSTILRQLLPELQPKDAGYVAWRGCIPETETPGALQGALEGKLLFSMFQGHYIIAYLTPGSTENTATGDRLLDWCWFCPVQEDSAEFRNMMADSLGHQHNKTVPRGRLRSDVWERQLKAYPLSSPWYNVIRHTKEPFVTAITSFEGAAAAFHHGKLLLVGEAFTQFRPHLGLSCNLAAAQALQLVEVFDGDKSIEDWNTFSVQYAQEFSIRSKAMGQFGLTGKWPEGYVPLYTRKGS
ncbi:hypothetical protein N0V90_011722 [Kalmusia sp. IMI 367209]|nr:hypothetical protein N0V90_011722 [Kalmusia sp. IMI 367209]